MEQTEYQKLTVLVKAELDLPPPSLKKRLDSLTRKVAESFLYRPLACLVGALADVVADRLGAEYQLLLNETSKCQHHILPPTLASEETNLLDMPPYFFSDEQLKDSLD